MKELASHFTEARAGAHDLRLDLGEDGEWCFLYPFGAVMFRDTPRDRREAELVRLRRALPRS